ncbi:MAG: hypothetical protein JNM71_12700 [Flavobacterium lindanitolerans]|nr:hypothetical protein [Flavobacterium lindanitolerans]MBL7868866.1 hypothetical protein [Flavobacterium lindanitolerans]
MRFPAFLFKSRLIALPYGYGTTGKNKGTVQEKRTAVGTASAKHPQGS